MAANTVPIFSRTPDIQWGGADGTGGTAGALKTANTALDGTGTVLTVFTADSTNGGFVQRLIVKPNGTNGSSVLRVFLNNGSTNATSSNNILITEITLSASSAVANAAMGEYQIGLNIPLPAGYRINVTLGATVTAGYWISCIGGKY